MTVTPSIHLSNRVRGTNKSEVKVNVYRSSAGTVPTRHMRSIVRFGELVDGLVGVRYVTLGWF